MNQIKGLFAFFTGIASIYCTAVFANCIDWPTSVFQPTPNTKTGQIAPDYGIYWFKHNKDGSTSAMRAFTPPALAPQFANGKINKLHKHQTVSEARRHYLHKLETKGYFDPNKPTLLFIHGDQMGATAGHKRPDFCYAYARKDGSQSPTLNTQTNWSDWNLAIFYWSPFADDIQGTSETDIVRAVIFPEMKIYSARNDAGMRWTYLDSHGKTALCTQKDAHCARLPHHTNGEPLSVSDLAYMAYINALPKHYSQPIRIVGQSLGTQIAIQLTHRVVNNHHLPQPTQLVLMDPYFSPTLHHIYVRPYMSDSVANYNLKTMRDTLATDPNLLFSIFRTTDLSTFPRGARNSDLEALSAYQRICPAYLQDADPMMSTAIEHLSAVYIYMHSKGLLGTQPALGAETDNSIVRQAMGTKRYCTIYDFGAGCQDVSDKPIDCPLESQWHTIK